MSSTQRSVVVSGGGTGIGLAIASWFVERGDRVTILGRPEHVLDEAVQRLRALVPDAAADRTVIDLEDPSAVEGLADTLGPTVDVLVANAGGVTLSEAVGLAATADVWLRDFTNNVLTTVLLTEALEPLLARPGGRVIAMSSVAALKGAGSYGAAKAALHAWVYSAAARLSPDGVTVNAVAPGFVPDTEFWTGRLTDAMIDARVARTMVGRPGTPAEVAEAVGYLASPQAGFTTGQILQVNGGAALGRG